MLLTAFFLLRIQNVFLWLLHEQVYSWLTGKLQTLVLVSDDNETFVHLVKQVHVFVHQFNKLTFDSHNVGQKHSGDSEDDEAKETVKKLVDDHDEINVLLVDLLNRAKLHN